MNELTISEANRLAELENQMEQDQTAFIRYGNALLEIRESRLYRQSHSSFEDYCRDRWQVKKSYAGKLIRAAQVVMKLGPIGPKPEAEGQVRPLTNLEPD